MKNLIALTIALLITTLTVFSQVAINANGNTANTSAMLDISSTSKGLLIPSMSSSQRGDITSPANGLLVYDTDTKSFWFYNSTASEWQKVGSDVAGASDIDGLSDARSGGYSVFVGYDAGSNDDGTSNMNTSSGYGSLSSNVDGDNNAALGYSALTKNNADYNTAIGSKAMYWNNDGVDNTTIGRQGLHENTSGNYNVGVGSLSGYNNKTGSRNTMLGFGAGYGNVNQNVSGSIFIGYMAGYMESNDNKLYISNTATPFPLIGGDFSTSKVEINGTLKIAGGSPGNNKVLTSDASGNATWETPATYASVINDLGDGNSDGMSVFLGINSGRVDDGANWNSGIGYNSFYSNISGQNNVGMGNGALYFNSVGNRNVAIGNSSLMSNTTGNSNVAIGYRSLYNGADKSNIVAIGDSALLNNGVGATMLAHSSQNTAVGSKSQLANTIGTENTTLGFETLKANTTGNNNVAIGSKSLFQSNDGSSNTAIGCNALFSLVSGTSNTAIGRNAGLNATGSHNIFLGKSAGMNETGSNKLYIANTSTSSPLIWGDFNTNIAAINGKLGIGTQAPTKELEVTGSAKISVDFEVSGDITTGGDITTSGDIITSEDFITSGNIIVDGDISFSTNKTYVMQIPARSFYSRNLNTSVLYWNWNWYAREDQHGLIDASLNLPQGSTITGISIYISGYNNSNIDMQTQRRQVLSDESDNMTSIDVNNASSYSDITEISTSEISYSTIDNSNYQYKIAVSFDADIDEEIHFYGAKITYTLDKVSY